MARVEMPNLWNIEDGQFTSHEGIALSEEGALAALWDGLTAVKGPFAVAHVERFVAWDGVAFVEI